MCAKLLILESPGKVKKVQEILDSGWKVAASVGHVRDLSVKEMGAAAPDFRPQYTPTDRGKDVLGRLAGAVFHYFAQPQKAPAIAGRYRGRV